MLDSTVSWAQVTDVIYPFVDSLCTAASDETNLSNRLFGQEMGYLTIELMNDKYANLKEDGYNVDHNDVNNILEKLVDGLTVWFYSSDEQLPHLWRDHYYVCHQQTDLSLIHI